MFDLWSFSDIDAVVSAGLGGGSLIYANVMIRKDEHWFVQEDPRSGARLRVLAGQPRTARSSTTSPSGCSGDVLPVRVRAVLDGAKTQAMKSAAAALIGGGRPRPDVAVAEAGRLLRGRHAGPEHAVHRRVLPRPTAFRRACRLCGECDIGCNDGAKNSLDYNYLTLAHKRAPTSGCATTSRSSSTTRRAATWCATATSPTTRGVDAKHAPRGEQLRCKVLVVSAGALGSTA